MISDAVDAHIRAEYRQLRRWPHMDELRAIERVAAAYGFAARTVAEVVGLEELPFWVLDRLGVDTRPIGDDDAEPEPKVVHLYPQWSGGGDDAA